MVAIGPLLGFAFTLLVIVEVCEIAMAWLSEAMDA